MLSIKSTKITIIGLCCDYQSAPFDTQDVNFASSKNKTQSIIIENLIRNMIIKVWILQQFSLNFKNYFPHYRVNQAINQRWIFLN